MIIFQARNYVQQSPIQYTRSAFCYQNLIEIFELLRLFDWKDWYEHKKSEIIYMQYYSLNSWLLQQIYFCDLRCLLERQIEMFEIWSIIDCRSELHLQQCFVSSCQSNTIYIVGFENYTFNGLPTNKYDLI
ncbi:Hypothetical_protein [Hexamita inflata]|uniref:Hypothetical_protein n=1 Tax=Hexamita inflata TaxID=28002 RepID=A0AA86RJQ5_9EUKA|nr:Hypothetical protein HINF_LOCUS55615 [Hexamita inflata]